MKPFNLEQAKAGKPVCTRDGKPARIICFDRKSDFYPIVALIGKDEISYGYTKTGKCFASTQFSSKKDLMMASEKHEGWINLYHGITHLIADYTIYKTQEDALADKLDSPAYKATAKIEWEE